ncbi:MAG: hypothetical protein ACWGSQ_05595 [Longimicrobiales bacterium]
METVLGLLALAVGVFLLDRVLLWVESRGWIYYRRTKPGRGASTYHLLEWNAAFDPTMRVVQEERVKEEREEEESGAPPGSGGSGKGGHGPAPGGSGHPPDRGTAGDPGTTAETEGGRPA